MRSLKKLEAEYRLWAGSPAPTFAGMGRDMMDALARIHELEAQLARQNEIMPECGHPRSSLRWSRWPVVPPEGTLTTVWCAECHAAGNAEEAERERCSEVVRRVFNGWGWMNNSLGIMAELEAAISAPRPSCGSLADGDTEAGEACRCVKG